MSCACWPSSLNAQSQSLSVNNDLQGALDVHNAARAEVGVAPLTWDDALAQEAEAYAQELAKTASI